jgi:D-amino-acid dehydrogenase
MHTIIIGGGVVGLATAYALAREGEQVTVVDARATGLGASNVNAGWIVPSRAAPVPGPGLAVQSMKWMLRSNSPLYIKPSADPQFLRFMLTMFRRCNARDQKGGQRATLRLFEGTMQAYDDYRSDGLDFEMHDTGLLVAFIDEEKFAYHCDDLDIERSYGLEPRLLTGDDLHAHEPLLSDSVSGAIYFPHERFVDPGALVGALHRRVVELGGGYGAASDPAAQPSVLSLPREVVRAERSASPLIAPVERSRSA